MLLIKILIFLVCFSSTFSTSVPLDVGWNLLAGDGSKSHDFMEKNPDILIIWGLEDEAWKVSVSPTVSSSTTIYSTYPSLHTLKRSSSYFMYSEKGESSEFLNVTTNSANLDELNHTNKWSCVGNISQSAQSFLSSNDDYSIMWGYENGNWIVRKKNQYYSSYNEYEALHKLDSKNGYFVKSERSDMLTTAAINMASVRLGYLSDSEVDLFRVDETGLRHHVHNQLSSKGFDLNSIGHFDINDKVLNDNDYYLYQVTNGRNWDFNNDNIFDKSPISNEGITRLIISGKDVKLIKNNLKISYVSEILFSKVVTILNNSFNQASFGEVLSRESKSILTKDINEDGLINQLDIYEFDPVYHSKYLSPYYRYRLEKILDNIHKGDTATKDIPAYFSEYDTDEALLSFDISEDNKFLFLSSRERGVEILDVSNPVLPRPVKVLSELKNTSEIIISKNQKRLYVAYTAGVLVYDIENMRAPKVEARLTNSYCRSIKLSADEKKLYLIRDRNFEVLDISNINQTTKLGSISIDFVSKNLTLSHDEKTAYISLGRDGFYIVDIEDPSSLSILKKFGFPDYYNASGPVYNIVLSKNDNYAYIVSGLGGLHLLDVSDRLNPIIVDHIEIAGSASDITISKDFTKVYVLASRINVFDSSVPNRLNRLDYMLGYGDKISLSPDQNSIYTIGYNSPLRISPSTNHNSKSVLSKLSVIKSFDKVIMHPSEPILYLLNYQLGNIQIVDTSNPSNLQPVKELKYFNFSTYLNSKIPGTSLCTYYSRDLVFSSDLKFAYLQNSLNGFSKLDISDPRNPVVLSTFDELKSYSWLDLSDDFSQAYAFGGRNISVLDLSSNTTQVLLTSIDIGNASSIVRSIDGQKLFTAGSSFKIFDITNPSKPVLMSTFQQEKYTRKMTVSKDESIAFLLNERTGIEIIDLKTMTKIGEYFIDNGKSMILSVKGQRLFVLTFYGLSIIDVSDLQNIHLIDSIETSGVPLDIILLNNESSAYLAGTDGLQIIDLSKYEIDFPTQLSTPNNINIINKDSDLIITWDSNYYADRYKVYFSTGSGVSTTSTFVTTTDSKVILSNLDNSQIYYFRIESLNHSVSSGLSHEVSILPLLSPPSIPINVQATALNRKISVSWDMSLYADKYKVSYSTNNFEGASYFETTTSTNYILIDNLANYSVYNIKIQAINEAGESGFTDPLLSMPQLPAPIFYPPDVGDTLASISWKPIANAKSYNIYYDFYNVTRLSSYVSSVDSSINLTNLRNNRIYKIKGIAISENGESLLSEELQFKSFLETPKLKTFKVKENTLSLNFDRVMRADSYNIYFDKTPNVSTSSSYITTLHNFATIKGLDANRNYYIRLESVNSEGVSKLSTTYILDPNLFIPIKVDKIKFYPNDKELSIDWAANLSAKTYEIQIAKDKIFSTDVSILTTNDSHISIGNLENYTIYYLRIKSSNSIGESDFSTVWSAVPVPTWKHPQLDLEMRLIPAGNFKMGDPNSFVGQDTGPIHNVQIESDFYISQYEVTNDIWNYVVKSSFGDNAEAGLNDVAKVNVSWIDLTKKNGFLDKFNKQVSCDTTNLPTDKTRYSPVNVPQGCFRLPTEAEWEYMATFLPDETNDVMLNLTKYGWLKANNENWNSHVVGQKSPNLLSIYDVIGNASEWVYDYYDEGFYSTSPELSPVSINSGPYHVTRGGNWTSESIKFTSRTFEPENYSYNTVGFRLVANPFKQDVSIDNTPLKHILVEADDSRLHVSFTPRQGANYYKIFYSNLSSVSETSTFLLTNLPRVTIPNLQNDEKYYIRVLSGKHFANESLISKVVTSTPKKTLPNTPKNFKLEATHIGFNLSWDKSENADSYRIYYSESPGVSTFSTEVWVFQNSYNLNYKPNDKYYFTILAVNDLGKSVLSDEIVGIKKLNYPENIEIEPGDSQVKVKWSQVGNNVSYNVYFETMDGTNTVTNFVSTTASNVTITGLTNNIEYKVRVSSIFNNNESVKSNYQTVLPLKSWVSPKYDIEMVKVPSGTYTRGARIGDYDIAFDQLPSRVINISKGFYVGKYEISQKQWLAVKNREENSYVSGTSDELGIGNNYPSHFVNHNDIVKVDGFLDRLNETTGCKITELKNNNLRYHPDFVPDGCFRLPTESEWEYLTHKDPTNYLTHENINRLQKIKETNVNSFGVFGLYGNVSEWVLDYYNQEFYLDTSMDIDSKKSIFNSVRGRSWIDDSSVSPRFRKYEVSTKSTYYSDGGRNNYIGFRIAMSVPDNQSDNVKPIAPSVVNGIELDEQIDLTWTPTKNTSYYKVYYDDNSPVSEQDSVIVTNNPRLLVDELQSGKNWYFRLQSINIFGESSDLSSEFTFFPRDLLPPDPTDLKAVPGDSSVLLSWKHNLQTDKFYIFYGDALEEEPSEIFEKVVHRGTSSILLDNLINDTTYYFAIGALNNVGQSELSEIVSATPTTPLPKSPERFGAYSFDTKVSLSWEPSNYAETYVLSYRNSNLDSGEYIQLSTKETSITISNLTNFDEYEFKVKAVSSKGESVYSEKIYSMPRTNYVEPTFGIELVKVLAGKFNMGYANDIHSYSADGPIHEVELTKNFMIGKFEITQSQWDNIMGTDRDWSANYNLSFNKSGIDNYPAVNVSWNDITREGGFLDHLNRGIGCSVEQLKKGVERYYPNNVPDGCFRLPTEAEWEYSARADSETRFSYGEDIQISTRWGPDYKYLSKYGWYSTNASHRGAKSVGEKLPNPWGLYDIHGNVSEWIYDYGYSSNYKNSFQIDPCNALDTAYRRLRGGSWSNSSEALVTGKRSNARPDYNKAATNGLRVVIVPKDDEITNIKLDKVKDVISNERDRSIELKWDHVEHALSYKILISSGSISQDVVTTNSNTILIDELTNGVDYKIEIQAINTFRGTSDLSTPVFATPKQGIPNPPENIVFNSDNGRLYISWDVDASARSYKVYHSLEKAVSVDSEFVSTTSTQIEISSLISNNTYYFKIQTISTTGESKLSKLYTRNIVKDFKDPYFGIDLVKISKGSFVMGSPDGTEVLEQNNRPYLEQDERPYHRVNITKDFYIGKYELTQGQWQAITKNNPWAKYSEESPTKTGENYPVFDVTWTELTRVDGFLDKLNQQVNCDVTRFPTDKTRYSPINVPAGCFRLPTEAEWEYMARGDLNVKNQRLIDENLKDYAVYAYQGLHGRENPKSVQVVGSKNPNSIGVYDAQGNVAEWVFDEYRYDYYNEGEIFDPFNTDGFGHTTRGNSWQDDERSLRIANRSQVVGDHHSFNTGSYTIVNTGVRLVFVPFEDQNGFSLSTPTNIQGEIGDSKVHLNWTPVIGASAYKIFYSTNVQVDTNSPHLLVYEARGSVPNLINNQKYYFKVGAINLTNGDNSLSSTVDFTPRLLVPKKPINLRGTSYDKKIHLSWDEVFHSDFYRVTYTDSSTSQSIVLTTVEHEINIDSLINNQDYYLFVESVNTAGIGEGSNLLKISPLETWIEPLSNIEMVRIRKGNYQMGSPSYEISANDEKPQRLVTLTNDFYIGKFEVTQKIWSDTTNQIVPHLDYDDRYPIGDKYPVMYVSWKEITTKGGFLDKLNKKIGCDLELLSDDANRYIAPNVPTGCFRLPTEAEWEYVARSGIQQSTILGDSVSLEDLSKYAWFNKMSSEYDIAEVGLKYPNFWGVFDMYGNVSEWVQDIYEEDYYSLDDGLDPTGPIEGYYHVHRGGSWVSTLNDLKVSRRVKKDPFHKGLKLGFRLAMTYPKVSKDLNTPTIYSVQESDSEITISWSAVDRAFAYKVLYFSDSSIKRQIITSELNCVISGLDNGKEYSFEVIAFNPSQQSPPTLDITYGTPRQ